MTKTEKCMLIAGWLEPAPVWRDWLVGETSWQFYIRSTECVSDGKAWEVYRNVETEDDATKHPRDFYESEEANALVLDKMRKPLLVSDWPGCEGWRVDLGVEFDGGPPIGPTHIDRKTAVCEAFLKWIEQEKR